ncbi:TRAP transporter small permease subunit [Aestuariicoccus sp. MJ-SS9]|uniref:TRAP transporter small permease subunit n=1 Tax=Aestuariicoccus sp. MJ-SS9 TaxID=3079855 RepID=UPI002915780B|nr:TRAP transporter small permease subunit [Aestuariicoccus sp. MJ-SS9]MDU8912320.1 TRAP transporter small permease subunit [Aestuariicoccus sp. MJ-SS9]
MARPDDNGTSPAGEVRETALERGWHRLVEGFAALGTVLIGVLMLIICADIVARNAAGASLPLVSEGGALLVVTLVALQLGATVRAGRLARTEVFTVPLNRRFPRAGAALGGVFDLVGAAVLGTIAWASIRVLEKDMTAGEFIGVPGIATLPTWPFRVLILAGFAVAAAQFAFRVFAALRAVRRPS